MANHVMWIMGARLAFAETIFEKKGIAGDPNSKPRYNCCLLLPADNKQVAEIEKITEDLVLGHSWKDAPRDDKDNEYAKSLLKTLGKKDRLALHDGDDKQKWAGFPGTMYLSPSSDTRPTTVNRDRSPLTKDDGVLYSGCYANAKVEIWVQDNGFGERVNVGLLGVQFVRDGDSFGAGSPPANPDDFPDLDASGGDDDDMFA